MRLRILLVVIMLLMPLKANAAITWDFSAISGTIQNVVTNIKVVIDTGRATIAEWWVVKELGSFIKDTKTFFNIIRERYNYYKNIYNDWKKKIDQFRAAVQSYYYSSLELYRSALDTAEFISEIGTRVQAYLAEGDSILKDAKDTVSKCVDNAKEMTRFGKQIREELKKAEANYNEYKAAQASLKADLEKYLEMNRNSPSDVITETIRMLRAKLDAHEAKIANIDSMINNYRAQLYNYIATQRNLALECVDRVVVIKARITRLTCNIVRGEYGQFKGQVNQLVDKINDLDNSFVKTEESISDLTHGFSGCGNINKTIATCETCDISRAAAAAQNNQGLVDNEACATCEYCKPSTDGIGMITVTPIPGGNESCEQKLQKTVREAIGGPSRQTCADYKNTCDQQIKAGNPNSDTCQISCSPLCGTLPSNDKVCCDIYRSKCNSGKQIYCDSYQTNCGDQLSFEYSLMQSAPTAHAFSFSEEDVNKTESNSDAYGNLLLPESLAVCCGLDAKDIIANLSQSTEGKVKSQVLQCIARYNSVIYAESASPISDDDKEFYQCLRKELGAETATKNSKDNKYQFEAQVRPSDSKIAGELLEDGYAEYLAGAYLDSLQTYRDTVDYKIKQIDPEAHGAYNDINSVWIAILNMNLKVANRINEIGKIWARDQLTNSVETARNYKITNSADEQGGEVK